MWFPSHALSAVLMGLSVRKILNPAPHCPEPLSVDARMDLGAMVAVVTGSTGGIGLETVKSLMNLGVGTVYATGRNRTALDLMKSSMPAVETVVLDLNSFDSVRGFAAWFAQRHSKLNILVLNGGLIASPSASTADGFELIAAGHSSVVHVASRSAHSGKFDPDHWRYQPCSDGVLKCKTPFQYYGDSKYLQVMFSVELNRRFESQGVISNAVHPGVVLTDAARFIAPKELDWALDLLRDSLSGIVFHTLPQAVATQLYVIFTPGRNSKGGDFLADCALRPWSGNDLFDRELGARIWTASAVAVGLESAGNILTAETASKADSINLALADDDGLDESESDEEEDQEDVEAPSNSRGAVDAYPAEVKEQVDVVAEAERNERKNSLMEGDAPEKEDYEAEIDKDVIESASATEEALAAASNNSAQVEVDASLVEEVESDTQIVLDTASLETGAVGNNSSAVVAQESPPLGEACPSTGERKSGNLTSVEEVPARESLEKESVPAPNASREATEDNQDQAGPDNDDDKAAEATLNVTARHGNAANVHLPPREIVALLPDTPSGTKATTAPLSLDNAQQQQQQQQLDSAAEEEEEGEELAGQEANDEAIANVTLTPESPEEAESDEEQGCPANKFGVVVASKDSEAAALSMATNATASQTESLEPKTNQEDDSSDAALAEEPALVDESNANIQVKPAEPKPTVEHPPDLVKPAETAETTKAGANEEEEEEEDEFSAAERDRVKGKKKWRKRTPVVQTPATHCPLPEHLLASAPRLDASVLVDEMFAPSSSSSRGDEW